MHRRGGTVISCAWTSQQPPSQPDRTDPVDTIRRSTTLRRVEEERRKDAMMAQGSGSVEAVTTLHTYIHTSIMQCSAVAV